MSFKFRLGEIVVPKKGNYLDRAKVEAIHLNGFMRIVRLDNDQKYMVRDKDYERFEEEVFEFNN